MRNSNAFVGNICTINLPCSVYDSDLPDLQKTLTQYHLHGCPHSPLQGTNLRAAERQGEDPSLTTKHSLLRDSPRVMSLTKKPTCIFVFSQTHT